MARKIQRDSDIHALPSAKSKPSFFQGGVVPNLFLRVGELRLAEWPEFDMEKRLWTIPGCRFNSDKSQGRNADFNSKKRQ